MKLNNQILVSIVIPTHNRADLLPRCLDSLIKQTYSNIEILVVDDFSTDNTNEVLEKYKKKDSRIISFKNESKGSNGARNTGVFAANGEYIALMDDDDTCFPDRIENQLNVIINSNFKYDFVISGYEKRNLNGKLIKTVNEPKSTESVGVTIRWFVKTSLIREVKGFDIDQPSVQEVELFWRLKEKANLVFDKSIVVTIIGAEKSITRNPERMLLGKKRLLDLHSHKMSNTEISQWRKSICASAIKTENRELFFSEFKKIKWSDYKFIDTILVLSSALNSQKLLSLYSKLKLKIYKL